MTKLFVGTDPEFMLFDPNTGHLKSAIGVIKGNKDTKVDLGGGSKCFPDNVNAEINIAPGDSPDSLVSNLYNTFHALSRTVYPYKFRLQASGEYPKKECDHPDAKVFGCEPEFCAYDLCIVQAPECTTTFRSCGGHIHLGYPEDGGYPLMAAEADDNNDRAFGRVWVVRMMDLFVGIPSLWWDQDPTSAARRRLYGKAGTHRPKDDYGVEYRATGHFWMDSPESVRLMYALCEFVVNFTREKGFLKLGWQDENNLDIDSCTGYSVNDLRAAIDGSDKTKAQTFLNGIVKKYLPANLYGQLLAKCEPKGDFNKQQAEFYKAWELA